MAAAAIAAFAAWTLRELAIIPLFHLLRAAVVPLLPDAASQLLLLLLLLPPPPPLPPLLLLLFAAVVPWSCQPFGRAVMFG